MPQFKKQSIQQLQNYNSRKKPLPKMDQADFLAKYDENFDDVFGDKPVTIDSHKGWKIRQEEEEDDENENDNERKTQKKKTQGKQRKQQSKEQKESQKDNKKTIYKEQQQSLDYKEFQVTIYYKDLNNMREFKETLEPKIQNEPKMSLPKFQKQRKRIANNHLSTLRSNSDGCDSVSNKDRESIQLNNKYNPNDIALPQTVIPKSEKKQDNKKTMLFTFGINSDDSNKDTNKKIINLFMSQNEKKDQNQQNMENKQSGLLMRLRKPQDIEQRETRILNSDQREKKREKRRQQKQSREKDEKIFTKSPSPEMKLIQYETQKRVKRSRKRVIEDLEMLNVDELSLNPNIVECKANLYLDYDPVYD
ncbi:unnamed protein product (macronuclear) [Paramecium tetraurelia]|uniref:Uncharacterized protein n=1 Tax=Paramecium tetraurelia TaxID=5888 RepID=A0E1U4_PARTE|nr:uncharacterized protein GSPATT00022432001 [Paramecium tetraurelia]CAK89261.1 unnamed protein product [Paramecium tetraurelia]|eukprot:XP_001456658.1 hypothetical protein (macronuclear) [Paramecium tetraurelia strain d4-2]